MQLICAAPALVLEDGERDARVTRADDHVLDGQPRVRHLRCVSVPHHDQLAVVVGHDLSLPQPVHGRQVPSDLWCAGARLRLRAHRL